jgi:cyclophilin family peptidyl-prolyl cis-trans isomerase
MAEAPAAEAAPAWRPVAPENLVLLEVATGTVAIELFPDAAPAHVARLRELKTDDNLLLMKTNMGAGHGGQSGRWNSLRETAEEFAFILWQMGMAPKAEGE